MSYGGGYGSGYEHNNERVSDVLSQETINAAIAADAARRAGASGQQPSSNYSHSSYEPDRPGISRRDTSSRRDPLTGDLIEEYSGSNSSGPGIRAHYNWDEPGKAPSNFQPQSSGTSGGSSQNTRPGEIRRTNTTVSYDSSGNRIEEHDGEGSLRVRALYNDDDPSTTYRPPVSRQNDGNSHRY